MLTFKFLAKPTHPQQLLLWEHANKLNSIYNYFLNQRLIGIHNKKYVQLKAQSAELPILKKSDKLLKQIHSKPVQETTERIDFAFKSFFKGIQRIPGFRSCKNFYGIHYDDTGYKIKNSSLYTKIYGEINFIRSREITGKVKTVSIINRYNKWYVVITTDAVRHHNSPNGKAVAIDLGLKHFYVSTDGEKIKSPHIPKYIDKKISEIQSRRDTRNKKGSNQYKRLAEKIRKLYELKTRIINDFQHKTSYKLANKYDVVIAEDLNIKSMLESNKSSALHKAISNASWGIFINMLKYKCKRLILVDPYNTSKMCNNCGNIKQILHLSERVITCACCGDTYDRDENAAKKYISPGTGYFSI